MGGRGGGGGAMWRERGYKTGICGGEGGRSYIGKNIDRLGYILYVSLIET
jgi:hypothetical protein